MHADARISAGFESMMNGIAVPPAPIEAIMALVPSVEAPSLARRSAPRIGAIAASIAVALLVPFAVPGFAQTIGSNLNAILNDLVNGKRPAMSMAEHQSFKANMKGIRGLGHTTVAKAQAHVKFTIVPPAGLPADINSQRIAVAAGMAYSTKDKRWTPTPAQVDFSFVRTDGQTFMLVAQRDGTGVMPVYTYIYELVKDAKGILVLVRRQQFAWRNGDQVMSTFTGPGINAKEIAAIRDAMHGTPLPTVTTAGPRSSSGVTVIEGSKP